MIPLCNTDLFIFILFFPRILGTNTFNNTIPFCKEDFKHIENVLACVQTQLESLFGNAIYETKIVHTPI